MTFDDISTRIPTRAHRARAASLGAVAVIALVCMAIASAHRALLVTHDLGAHARTTTLDAAPIVLWWALTAVLLWAALLFLRSLVNLAANSQRNYDAHFRFAVASWPVRIAALLLALTAFGGVNSSTAQASPPANITLATPAAPPAVASSDAVPRMTIPAEANVPEPGWTAPRPPADAARSTQSASLVTGSATPTSPETVVVRRGDTLWSIVGRHLGPGADARQIAATWPTWFSANRDVIGDNPDVLQVGQQLQIPSDAPRSATPVPAFDGSSR